MRRKLVRSSRRNLGGRDETDALTPKVREAMLRLVLTATTILILGPASANAATGYLVRAGDTLTEIARVQGTSVATLERLNGLAPDGVLLAGSTLRLPKPRPKLRPYEVQTGDTLTSLAERFHTSIAAIARANRMTSTQFLLSGTTVEIPGAGDRTAPGSSVRDSILHWSTHYGVDPRLATALAWMESGFNNTLISSTGAVGVMQIEPVTWKYVEQVLLLGRTVPHVADGNVRIGVALLHHLLRIYGGDERLALAAYYQGPRSLQANGALPETDQYVADILALEARF
jgi:LysM repeat protein